MKIEKKQAFTLAEIMIVILILTIILAAFAPLITKRRITTNRSKYAVWSYADLTNTLNAYYDPGSAEFTGELFFGVSPQEKSHISSMFLPYSKVVIRSGPVTSSDALQKQIQFRYGRNSEKGDLAGTWLMDTKNVLVGGTYDNMKYNTNGNTLVKNNLGIGIGALNSLISGVSTNNKAEQNTVLGYKAMLNTTSGKNNVAIGYLAGTSVTNGERNTYIGYMAGNKSTSAKDNTAIGYKAGAAITNADSNTYIGAYAGGGANNGTSTGNENVAVGYRALASITTGSNNTAIGYNALGNLTSGSYNTAIGYNACEYVTTGSKKTCIGYNSGPKPKSTGEKYLKATQDNVQRTYIGGTPYNYGGDAVLEIHNVGGHNRWLGQPKNGPNIVSNTTTVVNGNLVVRGRTFLTNGPTLRSYAYYEVSGSNTDQLFGVKSNGGVISGNQTDYTGWNGVGKQAPDLSSSDRRLKNIGSRSLAGLAEISKLKVYSYNYKKDLKKLPQVGVIAQDLRKIFPNSVTKDENGYLNIRWDEMFYASINAIKELDKKIIALAKRATTVESQIAQLEDENNSLKLQVENLSARIEKLKNK